MLLSLKSRASNPYTCMLDHVQVLDNDVRSRDNQILQLINTPAVQQESHSVLSKVTLSL